MTATTTATMIMIALTERPIVSTELIGTQIVRIVNC